MNKKTVDSLSQTLDSAGMELESLARGDVLHEAAGWPGERPDRVIRPANLDQLAACLPVARKAGVSLWTTWNASGNALVIPEKSAAPVLLDLSRLDQILAVDEASGYALVEPGVSHAQLAQHLSAKGQKFWLDPGMDEETSIAGAIWQRHFGYTSYGDTLMMQCGMEVMLNDGTLVRTGMGALPGENSWQLFKYGYGPYADGSFTQATNGVITKMGFWISPEPPAYRPFAWRVEDDATFTKLMEVVRDLRINMIVPNTIAAIEGTSEAALFGKGRYAAWNVYGALYGLPKNVDTIWGMLGGITNSLGKGTRLEQLPAEGEGSERAMLMSGRTPPSVQKRSVAMRGQQLRATFALPIEGEAALEFARGSLKVAKGSGCSLTVEQGTSWRALLAQVSIGFADGEASKAVSLGEKLISHWAAKGIGVVQASPALKGPAQSSYGDPGFAALRERIAVALA